MEKDLIIPKHIAIVLDGNRRWAKQRGLPTLKGHTEGADNLERIARYCNQIGVKYLTVYCFSTENWKRTEEEVSYLMKLFANYIDNFEKKFANSNAKIKVIGDVSRLPDYLQAGIQKIEEKTKNNNGIVLNLCINYGGREEIVHAAKVIAEKVKNGEMSLDQINEETFESHLRIDGAPDPELMIRAGGEMRLSGFLLWETSYSELYFPETLWPDFHEEELDKAILEFNRRKRNFGK